MRVRYILLLVVVSLLFNFNAAFGDCSWDKKIVLKSVDLPGNRREDGYWSAIGAGSDGKVYVALCTEGGGHAQFYIYDSKTGQMRHRADMAKVLGGYAEGIKTHAKVHSSIVEDLQGNIYFATGNMGAGPDIVDPTSWEGGRWVKYDPKTDKLYNLGLVAPHRGIYGMAIDKKRSRLLALCREGHFLIHDISTGRTTDKGRVCIKPHTVARTVVCDDEGNAYMTFHPDRIAKYDVKSDRVLDLSARMPSDPTVYPVTGSIYNRYMRSGVWDPISRKMYGVEGATSILFEFDPEAGKDGQTRALDRLTPYLATEAEQKGHYATLSLTLGMDRKIYYMPIGSMTPADAKRANKGVEFSKWAGQGYLLTYDIETGRKECLGRVYTDDGEMVIDKLTGAPSGGAITGPDGTIYFCVFVEEKDPSRFGRSFGNLGSRARLLIYKPR